jgi:streptomycin 6-kinase
MTFEIVNRLRKNSECLAPSIMLEAADAIERLIAERDEARREACGHGETIGGAMLEADLRGWDCFKQEDGK